MNARTHRIFVAVPLDAVLRDAVVALERRLEATGLRLRWVKPENLHFTLRFLGHISDAELDRVRRATREAAGRIRTFTISLAGLGAFPSPRRPQVVWVGAEEGADHLQALAAHLDDALARERFPREPRGFTPHLTLARVREPRLRGDLGRVLGQFEAEEVGEQEVRAVVVMESLLRPQGPIYTPVEEVPLSPYEK